MNPYLIKIAKALAKKEQAEPVRERPHVEAALKKLEDNDGVILQHSLGSGKTLLMLKAIEKAQKKNKKDSALVVAPASLVSNIDQEIKKHGVDIDRSRLEVYSFEKAVNIADALQKKHFSIVAVDEAHKLRNGDTKRAKTLAKVFENSDKRILATGTSVYNHPSDMSTLINIAAGYKALPENKKEFANKYIRRVDKPRSLTDRLLNRPAEKEDVLARGDELGDLFKDHVSYYNSREDPEAKDKFPEMSEEVIETEMSPDQAKYYKLMENKIPFMLRMKLRWNMPLDRQEQTSFNTFSVGTRQVSNTHRHLVQDKDSVEYSPKIKKAVENLESAMKGNPNFRGIAYSSFLEAGVHEYSKALKERGIKHGIFTGEQAALEKDKLREDFNSGKIPVLLLSSSGSEGLNTKGVRLVQHLDGGFHNSKTRQVTGRAVRFESHTHLPRDEQNVKVEYYRSIHPKSLLGRNPTSIDTYLAGMSDDKDKVFSQVHDLMKKNN